MYQFRPVSPRIKELAALIRDRVIPVDSVRAMAVTEVYQKNPTLPPMIKRAYAVKAVFEAMPLQVHELETFVGSMGSEFCGCGIYPEWTGESWIPHYVDEGKYTMGEDGLYHTPTDDVGPLVFTQKTYEDLSGIAAFWKNNVATAPMRDWQPEGFKQFQALRMSSYQIEKDAMSSPAGHLTPGHNKIITTGYRALREQARSWMDSHEGNLMGHDVDTYVFYSAVVIVCDAVMSYIHRYADTCRAASERAKTDGRKAELLKMADGLDNIAEYPARNFWRPARACCCISWRCSWRPAIPPSPLVVLTSMSGPI